MMYVLNKENSHTPQKKHWIQSEKGTKGDTRQRVRFKRQRVPAIL